MTRLSTGPRLSTALSSNFSLNSRLILPNKINALYPTSPTKRTGADPLVCAAVLGVWA